MKEFYNDNEVRPHQNSYLTEPIFRRRVEELYGDEYKVIGMYENCRTKIRMRHNSEKCSHYEWDAFPRNILNGHGCPRCNKRIVVSEEEFTKLLGNEYSLVSDYHGLNKPVTIRHRKHEIHEKDQFLYITPKQFIKGKRCPECERLKETEAVREEISTRSNGEYSLVGEFYSKSEKIRIRHNSSQCQFHEWYITLYNFTHGHGCPKCNKGGRKRETI